MSTVVVGRLMLSNGDVPYFSASTFGKVVEGSVGTDGAMQIDSPFVPCNCYIINGRIFVEFPEGFALEPDDIFRITRGVVDNLMLSLVADEGIGLRHTLEYCKMHSGEIVPALPDHVGKTDDEDGIASREMLYNLMGIIPAIRYAIMDYNQGLLYRDNCPFLFYRAIESLARAVCNKGENEGLGDSDWKESHESIGTSYTDMEIVHEIAKKHRHGDRVFFSGEQHISMMKSVRLFVVKSVNHFLSDRPDIVQTMEDLASASSQS